MFVTDIQEAEESFLFPSKQPRENFLLLRSLFFFWGYEFPPLNSIFTYHTYREPSPEFAKKETGRDKLGTPLVLFFHCTNRDFLKMYLDTYVSVSDIEYFD